MRNSLVCLIAVVCFAATTAFAQSVNISSPASGATVTSPVNVVANGSGGSAPVTALRLYVDNQPVSTVNGASLNTSATLSAGSHYVVVVGWNSMGVAFSRGEYINVSGSTGVTPASSTSGVTISSPSNGASVSSPVSFAANANASSGRVITAMRVYVDNNPVYTGGGSSLNTSVSLGTGNHYVAIVAWDNLGGSYRATENVSVGTTSNGGGSDSGGGGTSTSGAYQNDFDRASQWASTQSLPSGAIMYSTERINPYFANIAATGMVKDPKRYVQVQQWMQWYVNHLNWPDQWGIYGTTYDYNIVNGQEVSSGDADSTDSYAATFLTLAYAYYQTGDPNAQAYVRSLSYQLDAIGGVVLATTQPDGLTWAKPNYEMKYLMDNCEVYRGLADLAALYGAMGDTARQQKYAAAAALNKQGILGMWMGDHWAVEKDWYGNNVGPNMATWYPDASAQIFPVLYGVLPASDSRSQASYNYLNNAWPGWSQLSFSNQDAFPWVMVAAGAALMGDTARTGQYIQVMEQKYVSQNFPWTWYNMENGWFMKMTNYLNGHSF